MPRLIDPSATPAPIDHAEFVARLDERGVDLSHPDAAQDSADLLAQLSANRHFLADRAREDLASACRSQNGLNRYSAQVLMLHRLPGRHFVRANFWPAADDPALHASGASHYLYGVAHDHNFDFLTVGHIGPGYRSDWYAGDSLALAGAIGEPAMLRPVASGCLEPGQIMHYRAHRDVHRQAPPDRLSISLNIVPERAAVGWFDQYLFDIDRDCIAGLPTLTAAEVLLRIAVLDPAANGRDLADDYARHHPSERMRWAAITALAGAADDPGERRQRLESATSDASRLVSRSAAQLLLHMDSLLVPDIDG